MRVFLTLLVVLLLGAAGYGYVHNPEGCRKLGTDVVALFTETSLLDDNSNQAVAATSPDQNPTSNPNSAPASPGTSPGSTDASINTAVAQPFKKWTPPAILPAQPHWTWTTDDKTYQDVVINTIESDTVTITHSLGVTQLDIATLPADIQKQLNYDPAVAAATKAEIQRETDHPYYPMSNIADAEALAKQMHWPLAWLFSSPDALTAQNPDPNSAAGLTQAALNDLKTQAIVIFEKGNDELSLVPAAVENELFHLDDGPLPGGHHYINMKIVLSSPDATKSFGRVSWTQMQAAGMEPIDALLSNIQNDPSAQAILNGQPTPASSPTPAPDPAGK
jgi:hypothetical protein